MERATSWVRTPLGRGFLMAVVATAATGFAMSAQQNIVANYFEHELGLAGSQFGYITAIREIPGFLLIFFAALFHRLSLPKLTSGALVILAIGYGFFGFSNSFWTVVPWVILSSMGYHTFLQTYQALSMSMTTEGRTGWMLGRINAAYSGGSLVAMGVVLIVFQFNLLSYRSTFALCGLLALVGAIAIFGFPNLHNGEVQAKMAERDRIVLRKEYRYYYYLSLLDGGRQQIFFSFGLWVLVHQFGLNVPVISAILLVVTAINMFIGPKIGKLIDQHGERQMLGLVNVGYVIALVGYGISSNVYAAIGCYIIYSMILPVSGIGSATYLRKVAAAKDVAPSLAMGLSMQHAAAIIVPIATGFVLNYVGYQVPFLVASGFSCLTFLVTRRLYPEAQKSALRLQEEGVPPGSLPITNGLAAKESDSGAPSSVDTGISAGEAPAR
ncbi:MAG: MFS transporter [Chloroflexi bacterium]|nr:MFS transporter [Chloroflexota bacterium]